MKAAVISALSSGQGKTLFTTALLHWFKSNNEQVRAFKVGPDFIDPQFHEKITGISSINLDLYMANNEEVRNTFLHYSTDIQNAVIEGVMGFYDGVDYGSSTYEVAKTLNIPAILIVSAKSSYSTLIPIIKGILDYKTDNTIKGIILNRISSETHYHMIKNNIEKEIPVKVLGWINDGLINISSRHLGLDLNELDGSKLDELSESVLKNINIPELLNIMEFQPEYSKTENLSCELNKLQKTFKNLTLTIVNDKAFSFLYQQNTDFLNSIFGKVNKISAINNEEIPAATDVVYIPGGYAETPEVASLLDKADKFKKSLSTHSENPAKKIYAECAGLMFLGNKIQTTEGNCITGANILPLSFEIGKKRHRLGYYKAVDADSLNIYRGHAFHYSYPAETDPAIIKQWSLFKDRDSKATIGAWSSKNKNVTGTYLHTFFFNQPELVFKYFKPDLSDGEKND